MPGRTRADHFSRKLLTWYAQHGRHDLPWQENITAYQVWVSEIMLQQTQVATVIPYYRRFIKRFPDIKRLAAADRDAVMCMWTGLGYYARARHLHHTARIIMEHHHGQFPDTLDAVMALPGIGRSTAGAILSLAYGQRHAILDGNVKRVMARYHQVEGWPGQPAVTELLWQLAEYHTPRKHVAAYTQAIMDLGATVCIRRHPDCEHCPVNQDCGARQMSRVHEFPQSRPKKRLPVRQTVVAILENQHGEILLQQRPPAGIWGGLWSFPECKPNMNIKRWLKREWGYTPDSLTYKMPVRHTFSHFHLDITPVHISVTGHTQSVLDVDTIRWYRPDSRFDVGLAAPVQKLMAQIATEA